MWNDLTLKEKAEIMKMSVANGVTDINDIQQLYDDSIYAEGGHIYDKAGPLNKAKQQPKYQYGIIEQVLRENGVNFRVTSGARKPNQAGNAGKSSAHTYTIFGNSPGAIDIVPGVGSDWNTLFAQMNSPRVRKALAAYGLDVLNETNPNVMASTHATGPHLHVGRGIKGQAGMGQMFGGTSYGGGKGDMYAPTYGSRGSSRGYDSGYQNFTGDIEPITIEGGNRDSGWLSYVASVNKPISFNTPIGATTLDSNLSNVEFTPTDFSMLNSDVEIATPLNPTVAKRNMEYSLELENNALWNSPYLMFNAHSGANGGHLYEDGSMLLRNNAVNPLMQYVYGPEYEEIVRNNRNYVPSGNIVRNKPRYNIKQETDVIANTTKPIQKSIRRKQTSESVARRDKEQQQHDAMANQYRIERQGTISQAPDRMRHPDYDPVKANEVQQRYEQNEIAEQNAYNRRVLEHNVLEGMEAIPWPSTIAGSLFNPNTHCYDPGSFFTNLYSNDNRGLFNFNQATRDFYDENPEVGSVANLIGDFVVPGAAAKALKGVGKTGKFINRASTAAYNNLYPLGETSNSISLSLPTFGNIKDLPKTIKGRAQKLKNEIDAYRKATNHMKRETIFAQYHPRLANFLNEITFGEANPIRIPNRIEFYKDPTNRKMAIDEIIDRTVPLMDNTERATIHKLFDDNITGDYLGSYDLSEYLQKNYGVSWINVPDNFDIYNDFKPKLFENAYQKFIDKHFEGVDPYREGMRAVDARLNAGGRDRIQQLLDNNAAIRQNLENTYVPYKEYRTQDVVSQSEDRYLNYVRNDLGFTGEFKNNPYVNADNIRVKLTDDPNQGSAYFWGIQKLNTNGDFTTNPVTQYIKFNPIEDIGIPLTKKRAFRRMFDTASHEYAHANFPTSGSYQSFLNPYVEQWINDYLIGNGTEGLARGTQIKNDLMRRKKWKEGEVITGKMLKQTLRRYRFTTQDNNLTEYMKKITDWDAAAKWITKYAPGVALPIALEMYYNKTTDNHKSKNL